MSTIAITERPRQCQQLQLQLEWSRQCQQLRLESGRINVNSYNYRAATSKSTVTITERPRQCQQLQLQSGHVNVNSYNYRRQCQQLQYICCKCHDIVVHCMYSTLHAVHCM